jgi:hypothetical protein
MQLAPSPVERKPAVTTTTRHRQPYIPREVPTPPIEVVAIEELLGGVAPIDFIAALAGHRGAVVRLGSEAAP